MSTKTAKEHPASTDFGNANLEILSPQSLLDYRYPHHLCDAIESDKPNLGLGYGLDPQEEKTDKYLVSGSFKNFGMLPPEKQLEQLTRFKGICALYGYAGFRLLQRAHVVILGTGGVGSWIAESMCRSAVGTITLIDFDVIELSNTNRQLHTLNSTQNQYKVDVLGQRLLEINPYLNLRVCKSQITKQHYEQQMTEMLMLTPDQAAYTPEENLSKIESPAKVANAMLQTAHPIFVADAIDDAAAKSRCVDFIHRRRIPLIVSGGAGGRKDATKLQVADLSQAKGDQLIRRLRNDLRRDFGYPKGDSAMFNIACTYSDEIPAYSTELTDLDKAALMDLGVDSQLFNQLPSLPKFGASMSVTASAGLMIASTLVRWICGLTK